MAYKKDINLFKAAGGGAAKSKKMPLTKKLLIVMVVVTVICGAVIGFLLYLNGGQNAEYKELTDKAEAYTLTENSTKTALEQFAGVEEESKAIEVIEYYNESYSSLFSCLSTPEITAIKTYIDGSEAYTTDFSFSEVSSEILSKLAVLRYSINEETEESFVKLNNINYIYAALTNMVAAKDLYSLLPAQNEEDIWYSYYRGQIIMVTKGLSGTNAEEFTTNLCSPNIVNCAPFMSIYHTDLTVAGENFNINCSITVNLDDVDYTVFCITRKTCFERLLDIINNRIIAEEESEVSAEIVDYYFSINSVSFSGNVISFEITMYQTANFGLEEICLAINESDFFNAEKTLAFPTSDVVGEQTKELEFTITNSAYSLIYDKAISKYTPKVD